MIELTDEYHEAAKKFKQHFGYGVPLRMIPPLVETTLLIRNIYECIENNQDDLLERFNVEINDGDLL